MTEQRDGSAERYRFIVPVWGSAYVDMFVNYSIPSQLSKGNIPALPLGMTSYQILTHPEDVQRIRNAASVKLLRNYCDVIIEEFQDAQVYEDWKQPDSSYINNLFRMSWCYQRGLNACRGTDTAFWFMTPDSVLADGAFQYVHQRQVKGYRAVMALGLITDRDRMRTELQARFRASGCERTAHERFTISPRQLVDATLKSLHPLAMSRYMKDGGNRFYSAYYWPTSSGFVARCFYLHPMMVRPRRHIDRMPCTVDYRYVQAVCPDNSEIHVVNDSDKLFYVDMADFRHINDGYPLLNHQRKDILVWMREWTDYRHRHMFKTPILVHTEDVDGHWSAALEESDRYAEGLLEDFYLANTDLKPDQLPEYPTNLMVSEKGQIATEKANTDSNSTSGQQSQTPAAGQVEASATVSSRIAANKLTNMLTRLARRFTTPIYQLLNQKLCTQVAQLEQQLALQNAYTKAVEERLHEFMERLNSQFWGSLGCFNKTAEEIKLLRPFLLSIDFSVQQQLTRLEQQLAEVAGSFGQISSPLENDFGAGATLNSANVGQMSGGFGIVESLVRHNQKNGRRPGRLGPKHSSESATAAAIRSAGQSNGRAA